MNQQSVFQANLWNEIVEGTRKTLAKRSRQLSEARLVSYGGEYHAIQELGKEYGLVIVCGGIGFLRRHSTAKLIAKFIQSDVAIHTEAVLHFKKYGINVAKQMVERASTFPEDSTVISIEEEALSGFYASNFLCIPNCENFQKMIDKSLHFLPRTHTLLFERMYIDSISTELEALLDEIHFEEEINIEMAIVKNKIMIELSGFDTTRLQYLVQCIEDIINS
jgi:molybdopterin-biosynthesis enzyme MoeA-like protein